MKETKVRQSNFELMRIVSMFFIALCHFLVHGNILNNSEGIVNNLSYLIISFALVHVDSFVLLTGYFNYNKDFKLSRIFKVNNSMWFYRVLYLLLAIFVFSFSFSKTAIIQFLSPIPRITDYWFLIVYIMLCLVSPILNLTIKNSTKETHKKIIIALLFINILSFFTNNDFYSLNNGFSLFSFILLYYVGSYLHKYTFNNENKKTVEKNKKRAIICLSLYAVVSVINFSLFLICKKLMISDHLIIQYYSRIFIDGFQSYLNPLVLLSTVLYFIFFSQLKFKNRIINFYGKYILGVYLLTDCYLARTIIYKELGFNLKSYSIKHLFIAIGLSIAMIIVLPLFEFVRTKIFEFFYNRKLAKKNRENIQKLIYKTGINVKW